MTTADENPTAANIVVHADNVDDETLAALVTVLSVRPTQAPPQRSAPGWQLAALHEGQGDMRIVRPQQLSIRGNEQW